MDRPFVLVKQIISELHLGAGPSAQLIPNVPQINHALTKNVRIRAKVPAEGILNAELSSTVQYAVAETASREMLFFSVFQYHVRPS